MFRVTDYCRRRRAPLLGMAAFLAAAAPSFADSVYYQINLASDIAGLAANTDPSLKNPWGVSFGPTTPFWVSNQVTGNTTLYNGAGVPQSLVVTVPPGLPTGQVFGGGNFTETSGLAATFIFATLAGTVDAWNSANGTTAAVQATTPGAVYTGLASANNGSGNFLYAADFKNNRIDVFNSNFAAATLTGSFKDPNLPAGYAPYNVQNIGGSLYVEYAQVGANGQPVAGSGLGFVSVFDANGNFVRRVASGGALNAPWGIVMAPSTFGSFSNDLLVGNFGNGMINAFNPSTGAFVGTLSTSSGPIVDSGLWSLEFRTGGANVNTSALYITAGINNQADGLFASIQVVPEPGTIAAVAGGIALLLGLTRRRRAATSE